jgi:hypothetical protein
LNMLWIASILVFLVNLPFGYWRSKTRKYSLQWILSIHIPVPFVIASRIILGLGWRLNTFPVLIGSFFAGQLVGAKLRRQRIR